MTKEELRKETTSTIEWESTQMIDRPLFVHAYITGAEPREKRIEELEKENAELKERNRELLESCEGATMMYKDLCKAKGIIQEYIRINLLPPTERNFDDEFKTSKAVLRGGINVVRNSFNTNTPVRIYIRSNH